MNGMSAPVSAHEEGTREPAVAADSFLVTLATLLQETVSRFEATVGRVTDLAVNGPARTDRDLVVAMQDFDRLQQEFASIAGVLAKLGMQNKASPAAPIGVALEAIADIPMSHLKARLSEQMQAAMPSPVGQSEELEEMIF